MASGSPPLARRGQRPSPASAGRPRLTSARAERTLKPGEDAALDTAHLRSRGEDSELWTNYAKPIGSPPLARRGHLVLVPRRLLTRLTSARAERTQVREMPWTTPPAHLRSRGEDGCCGWWPRSCSGSPPLARREHDGAVPRRTWRRLTSARAERTCGAPATCGFPAAHLRSRGEDSLPAADAASKPGSPPLARRGQLQLRQPHDVHRLTSARAERTRSRWAG